MLKTESLSKVFMAEDMETLALNKVDFTVNEGEFVAIMGPSGCGKSTLLNILGLLDTPTQGNYYFQSENMAGYSENHRARIRKNKIGFIFQNFNLIDELTIFENIELPLVYNGIESRERKVRVQEELDKMGILHRKNHFPIQLSGGQQQRVAIARALITNPQLILADEPTGNLDSAKGEEIMEMLTTLNNGGTTIVMVTHSKRDAEYSSRIVNLFDGKIVSERR
ncbi:MAG: ABC transporter ATP-binding protein [Bacteroidales bacterium]|nr:ABC transporter ATP-binding protein [Bacteroidales bacterium]MDD4604220.1 ABC transporter ATP-binding protein [Bacteroidales bacterium]